MFSLADRLLGRSQSLPSLCTRVAPGKHYSLDLHSGQAQKLRYISQTGKVQVTPTFLLLDSNATETGYLWEVEPTLMSMGRMTIILMAFDRVFQKGQLKNKALTCRCARHRNSSVDATSPQGLTSSFFPYSALQGASGVPLFSRWNSNHIRMTDD